jgi:hypothetical protein
MSNISMRIAHFADMLPEREQYFAFELIKKLVLAWDPDFTRLTTEEAQELDEACSAPLDTYISLDDI